MDLIRKFLGLPLEEKMVIFSVCVFIFLGLGLLLNSAPIIEIINRYGLTGLFFASFIGSTVFLFFSIESLFVILIKSGVELLPMILVATAGGFLGTCVNYFIGYSGSHFIEGRYDKEKFEKAKKLMNKYGWVGLFLLIATPLPLPIPTDPITVIPGIARMNFWEFTVVIFSSKLIRYFLWVGGLSWIINGLF